MDILLRSQPEPNNPALSDNDFGDFIFAPYSEYVARYGCTLEHVDFSLQALYHMTQRFSAEDAIRYFINAFPQQTLEKLGLWTSDAHYHVRRVCSEGTRPKLPWAQKITLPITEPLPILEVLFADKTRFVTRSVANHINDISKINPELALTTLAHWQQSARQSESEMNYIIRHGLRSLIKQGHPTAMAMLGLSSQPKVTLRDMALPAVVSMNTYLDFSFVLEADEASEIIIDYILYFQSKLGQLKSKKVFKLKRLLIDKKQAVLVSKKHLLRQWMTTRTLYPGKHELAIQINGNVVHRQAFQLV